MKPDFPSLTDEIAERRPYENINVAAFTVGEKSYNTIVKWESRYTLLIDFSLTVKAAILMFISGRGSAISSAKEWKSGFIHNLVKS